MKRAITYIVGAGIIAVAAAKGADFEDNFSGDCGCGDDKFSGVQKSGFKSNEGDCGCGDDKFSGVQKSGFKGNSCDQDFDNGDKSCGQSDNFESSKFGDESDSSISNKRSFGKSSGFNNGSNYKSGRGRKYGSGNSESVSSGNSNEDTEDCGCEEKKRPVSKNRDVQVQKRNRVNKDNVKVQVDEDEDNTANNDYVNDNRALATSANDAYARNQDKRNSDVESAADHETHNETDNEAREVDKSCSAAANRAHHREARKHFDLAKENSNHHDIEFAEQQHQDAGIRQGLCSQEDIELKEHVCAEKDACKGETVDKKRWLKKKCHKKSFREKKGLHKCATMSKNKGKFCDKFGVLKKTDGRRQNIDAASQQHANRCTDSVIKKCDRTDDETQSKAITQDDVDNATFAEANNVDARSAVAQQTAARKIKNRKNLKVDVNDEDKSNEVDVRANSHN